MGDLKTTPDECREFGGYPCVCFAREAECPHTHASRRRAASMDDPTGFTMDAIGPNLSPETAALLNVIGDLCADSLRGEVGPFQTCYGVDFGNPDEPLAAALLAWERAGQPDRGPGT